MIAPLMYRMAARNRARRAEDRRFETQGLHDIDTYATNAKHKKGVNGDEDKLILRLMQTGSNWTRQLTKTTGREEDETCSLCGEVETEDHCWYCGKLETKRKQVDEGLAEADP